MILADNRIIKSTFQTDNLNPIKEKNYHLVVYDVNKNAI